MFSYVIVYGQTFSTNMLDPVVCKKYTEEPLGKYIINVYLEIKLI